MAAAGRENGLMKPLIVLMLLVAALRGGAAAAGLPNVLWITSEDNGPELGCYGNPDAVTPHLDGLAARGLRFDRVWSVAPVCAPARTALITGAYPSAVGALHMRSQVPVPAGWELYPQLLRKAGVYCTNNAKEDYNVAPRGKVWDESSKKAHWRNRPEGQPFLAVFNIELTHESQVRRRPHKAVHAPETVRLRGFWPDLPEVRQDWAQYMDNMTAMDRRAGELMAEIEAAGLAADTIIIYCGDHGPGMPRCKRTPCDSGLRVPLLVHVPEKWRHLAPAGYAPGGVSRRLVSFVDFAPTFLSIYGVPVPGWMQGRAFAGTAAAPAPEYLFGMRDRMDERYDPVRSVTDGRWVYVRNFFTHRPAGQHVAYQFETPTTQVWHAAFKAGKLDEARAAFWKPHPAEQLHDLEADPDEVRNLAGDPAHRAVLERMRSALLAHERAVRDISLLPEAEMLRRANDSTPYEIGHDDSRVPLEALLGAALRASAPETPVAALRDDLASAEAGVRWWAAMGCRMRGPEIVRALREPLASRLKDPNPSVRLAAAEALAVHGEQAEASEAVGLLMAAADLGRSDHYDAVRALNALGDLPGTVIDPLRRGLAGLPRRSDGSPPRSGDYIQRLLAALGVE